MTIGTDGFGAFGSSVGTDATNAFYDPTGVGGVAGTVFESGVAIGFGGPRTFLTSGDIGGSGGLANPATAGTLLSGMSSFSFGGLEFVLTQTLTPLFTGLMQTGSVLTQSYVMTNSSPSTLAYDLVRYLDGDLLFDGSLIDGGGTLGAGTGQILFETDSATGAATPTTFVGITGVGGVIPGTDRFEISSFSGLRALVLAGTPLGDFVSGDVAPVDGFIDAGSGYDVTLALRNVFSLGAGATDTYTTTTIFGSGTPDSVARIPEPSSVALLSMAMLGMCGSYRRKRRNAQKT